MKEFHLWIINFAKLRCVLRFRLQKTLRGDENTQIYARHRRYALNFFHFTEDFLSNHRRSLNFLLKNLRDQHANLAKRSIEKKVQKRYDDDDMMIIEWVESTTRHLVFNMRKC